VLVADSDRGKMMHVRKDENTELIHLY